MSFVQIRLDKSVNQTREIFDKFIYRPGNGDTLANVLEPGYFSKSRFSGSDAWVNAIIEAELDGGFYILGIDENGNAFDRTPGGPSSGVQSVTGDGVDNSDPANPVLSFPDASEVSNAFDKSTDDASDIQMANSSQSVQNKIVTMQNEIDDNTQNITDLEDNKLSEVSVNSTLSGNGKPGSPLGVNDIVNLINQALGVNFWQQGISNAIFVNDVSEDSLELSPYLANSGPNTGKWEVGSDSVDGTQLIVINIDRNSLAAIQEREFAKVGELQIVSSAPGQTKGLVMTAGVGVPEMQHMISSDTSGALRIETIMFSDDVTRPAFDITDNTDGFFFQGVGWALANPGSIDTRTIDIDCEFLLLQQSYCVIGSACEFFNFKNANMDAPLLGCVRGFDLSSVPTSGTRIIEVDPTVNTTSGIDPGDAAFLIDQDNGDNIGLFSGTRNVDPVGNRYILADNDAAFNANPQKSLNFEFNVPNFVVTQRVAEVGIVAGSTTTINNPDEATDLAGPFILDFSSTSGFEIDPSNGAIINKLRTPATYKFTFELSGNKVGGGTSDFEIYANYKPASGVYAPILVDDGTNSAPVKNRNEFTAGADPGVLGFSFTQRFENIDDEVKIQIADIV
ncbi:MAG: hypothetical protein V3R32_00920, partial [Nitrosomonadaceae bacterium]